MEAEQISRLVPLPLAQLVEPEEHVDQHVEEQKDEQGVEIDWKLEEGQINSYRLNDAEVKEALTLLEEAKKWVTTNGQEVTQRIRLIARNGNVLHVIRCKNGLPNTKDIRAPEASEVTKYFEFWIFDYKWVYMFYQFSLTWMRYIMKYFI